METLLLGAGLLLGAYVLVYYNLVKAPPCGGIGSLRGRTAVVTGANSGIGKMTALELARRGARVVLACRSRERGEAAAFDLRQESGNNEIIFMALDLASLASVQAFATAFLSSEPRLDILIHNAGPVNSELFLRHLPGWLCPILRPLAWLVLRAPQGGAQTPLYCALQEGIEPLSGRYFANCRVEEVSPAARDDQAAHRLWKATKKLAGLGPGEDDDSPDEEPRPQEDLGAQSSLNAPSSEKTTVSGPSQSSPGSPDLSTLTRRRIQMKAEPTH